MIKTGHKIQETAGTTHIKFIQASNDYWLPTLRLSVQIDKY
jgi:hypothetical protein